MSLASMNNPKGWAILAIAAAAVGALVWGAVRWTGGSDSDSTIPKELTVSALKAGAANPGEMMDTIRTAMDREDLTEEQRRQAFQNMREVWESSMNERVDEYFTASEEDKVVVLDKHIDEMEAFRKAMEERRAEWERRRQEGEGREGGPRGGFMGSQSREERKDRSESRNADQTAQRMAYFMALGNRMSQRGISMPFGRGGGGMGGGPRRGP